jgi:hypothetical protein
LPPAPFCSSPNCSGTLAGIVINLLLIPGYFDVALRDFGLMLGALALARLSEEFAEGAA